MNKGKSKSRIGMVIKVLLFGLILAGVAYIVSEARKAGKEDAERARHRAESNSATE